MKANTTAMAPTSPISVAMAAKTMSLVSSGMERRSVSKPSPVPPTPPVPMEYHAWASW